MESELQKLNEEDGEDYSDEEAGGDRPERPGGVGAGCPICCCCCLVIVLIQGCIAFGRNSGCSAQAGNPAQVWSPIIPAWTTSQYQWKFLWSEVNVYNPKVSNETEVGQWVSMAFMGMLTRYGYEDVDGNTLLEARTPWGFYLGKRYEIWRCDGAGPDFRIEDDYWAQPWFSFGQEKRYKIFNAQTQQETAKCAHSKTVSIWRNNWAASCTNMAGEEIATLNQQDSSGWFSVPIWSVRNKETDMGILPNAVVSLMAALYDLERVKETDS